MRHDGAERPHRLTRLGSRRATLPVAGTTAIIETRAHLDTVHTSPGAMDDGMGVAAVMETARLLHALGWRPARTVRFVLFTGEELAEKGSTAYVAAHSAKFVRQCFGGQNFV